MKNKQTKYQTLKGFRDFYGSEVQNRRYVISVFEKIFEKYGYRPLETPALEYAEVLSGKSGGEMDQMAYLFTDAGGRKIGLRYDMTVPSCRFVAQHYKTLAFPFKRYMIQPAWRAEKPQKGRYREFMQCDADVWGTPSVLVEAEFIQMGCEALETLGFTDFVTRLNNRKIIDAVFASAGADPRHFPALAIAIDKLEKTGPEAVKEELERKSIPPQVIRKIFSLLENASDPNLLSVYKKTLSDFPKALEGIREIEEIFSYLETVSVDPRLYRFDPTIIRGMSYYTGPVWEFSITDGDVGSVGGAGRYDRLTGLYTDIDIPASGGSFGLERIVEVMKDRNMFPPQPSTQVLVTIFSKNLKEKSFVLARKLRQNGISAELYPDPDAKLPKQLKYADKKGIPFALIVGPDEARSDTVTLKDLNRKKQETVNFGKAVRKLGPRPGKNGSHPLSSGQAPEKTL